MKYPVPSFGEIIEKTRREGHRNKHGTPKLQELGIAARRRSRVVAVAARSDLIPLHQQVNPVSHHRQPRERQNHVEKLQQAFPEALTSHDQSLNLPLQVPITSIEISNSWKREFRFRFFNWRGRREGPDVVAWPPIAHLRSQDDVHR
ncbi:hypothetical protein GW17_00012018 [Ensete ventricosum]|nr:hypothetical protein GW17_00012018 [Ensete ventricosum]RZR89030.1 hypothetical protein BHM03_00016697 [Ensete ventricosum]